MLVAGSLLAVAATGADLLAASASAEAKHPAIQHAVRAASTPVAPIAKLLVTPAAGGDHSVFTVHFIAKQRTGLYDGEAHTYSLTAGPVRYRSGCVDAVSLVPRPDADDEPMAVHLVPSEGGHQWCIGDYSGEVSETVGPGCGPVATGSPTACPMFVVLERIGNFRFKVSAQYP